MRPRLAALALLPLVCAVPAHAQPLRPTASGLLFGGVDYVTRQRGDSGFHVAQTAGLLSVGLTERISAVGEVTATPADSTVAVRVERLYARYEFADALKLSVGRFHTLVVYWNTAYHHATWLQTSVSRPELIRYGTPLVPLHFAGIQAEGVLPPTPLGLGYVVGVGHGRATDPADPSRSGEVGRLHDRPAWVARVYARPPGLGSMALGRVQVGGSAYLDRALTRTGAPVDERILSAHFAWEMEYPEVMAEYAQLQHRAAGAGGAWATGHAWYVQLGGRMTGKREGLKTYTRAEAVRVADDDALLAPLGLSYNGVILGLRWDVVPFAALRAEFRREGPSRRDLSNSLFLQASFALAGTLPNDRPHAAMERQPGAVPSPHPH
ncbi:MAG TPA: hypothetical protein VF541_09620 [Longimicrobium sp.]